MGTMDTAEIPFPTSMHTVLKKIIHYYGSGQDSSQFDTAGNS